MAGVETEEVGGRARRGLGAALHGAGVAVVLLALLAVIGLGLVARPLLAVGVALAVGALGALVARGPRARRLWSAGGFAAFGLFVVGLVALGVGG